MLSKEECLQDHIFDAEMRRRAEERGSMVYDPRNGCVRGRPGWAPLDIPTMEGQVSVNRAEETEPILNIIHRIAGTVGQCRHAAAIVLSSINGEATAGSPDMRKEPASTRAFLEMLSEDADVTLHMLRTIEREMAPTPPMPVPASTGNMQYVDPRSYTGTAVH